MVALALLGIFEASLPILYNSFPGADGHAGWGMRPSDQTLIAVVVPGSEAARAGVRPGDRLDLDRLFPDRKFYDPLISYHPPPGTRVDFPLIRGSQRFTAAITLEPRSASYVPPWAVFLDDLNYFASLLILLLGAWIVARRPSLMTWSLFAFLLGNAVGSGGVFRYFGYDLARANSLVGAVVGSCSVLIVVFASRVPNDAPAKWRRWFGIAAIALFGIALFVNAYAIVTWSIFGLPARYVLVLPSWAHNALRDAVGALTIVALVANYAISRGQDRERMRWVALGVTMLIAATILSQVQFAQTALDQAVYLLFTISNVVYLSGLAAIAYGLIKGRIVDVTFVLGHAVAASILAGFIIAAFALADWGVSKVVASARLGTLADVGLAIILGFSFSALHRRVDALVDRLFFRRRYNAEHRLKLAAHAVLHSTSLDAIREFLIDEAHAALDLASAALFEPAGASQWKRTRAIGWPDGSLAELAADDIFVSHVLAKQSPLKTSSVPWLAQSLPTGLAHPVLAVPVLARQRVAAIALYGQHRSGADLDADEIAAIERVADGADAAFDHVEAENLRRENEAQARRIAELTRRLNPEVSSS